MVQNTSFSLMLASLLCCSFWMWLHSVQFGSHARRGGYYISYTSLLPSFTQYSINRINESTHPTVFESHISLVAYVNLLETTFVEVTNGFQQGTAVGAAVIVSGN